MREVIGEKSIDSFKYSDIKKFYISLIRDRGFKPTSMEIIHTILHPIFTLAVRDNFIRSNPTDGVMADIKKSHRWEKPKKHALTEDQQAAFMRFISASPRYRYWLPLFTVMLGTGCRVGEVIGLRWEDCDFEKNIISINHSLVYRQQEAGGPCSFYITTPKTDAGVRIVPMVEEVKNALRQERQFQEETGFNTAVIDGYSGFIFKSMEGGTLSPHSVNRAIECIRKAYNAKETDLAAQARREPLLLPHFSAHNLRHTFCTRFCEIETNLKVIQEIMGHASITTTMDIYNEATPEQKMASFQNLEVKIKLR